MTPKTRRRLFALVPVLALVVLAEICTRVVCVGDSVTFGNSFDDSWPGRLQRRLNDAEPGRFVVFNAATPGHNVVQCKRLLQSRWIDLAPDVVVWLEKSRFADRVELPEPIDHGRTAALEQIYRFRALYLLTAAAQAWSARRADPVARAFDSSLAPATGAQPNVLPELARWCGERGVRAFVALAYL
ncbi:MAG: SGNH/GDSL hydrolase family protein, partial [Deltaproteobacteria bacterium]|nr:SGNH/GDSL hydrolase family protein [Deltaproteobacteria bacterium]